MTIDGHPSSVGADPVTAVPELAGKFLTEVADRLDVAGDRALIRATLDRACGGQLDAYGPDGRRASTLTALGTPLEVSVTGGAGTVSPAVRFVTETATQRPGFADRLGAQLDAVRDLVGWLPNSDRATAEKLISFVSTLYPDPTLVAKKYRSSTWLGVVHHGAVAGKIARLKVYGGLRILPGALARLHDAWPGFAGLGALPDTEDLFTPAGAALEVDARGDMNHKIYLKTRYNDAATPMRLVRCFGDPAWEVLSEFVRSGLDAATLYRYQWFICCSRGTGPPEFGVHLMRRRRADPTPLVDLLASRHHGTLSGVEALAGAAEATGAKWMYTGVGLGFSSVSGVGKLNVYGVPDWRTETLNERRNRSVRGGING